MNGLSVTEYDCAGCAVTVTRPPTKGQRPRWCADCRASGAWSRSTFTCEGCGSEVNGWGTRFCSMLCCNRNKPPRPKVVKVKVVKPPVDRRGDMRAGLEDEDWPRLARAIRASSKVDEHGCWIWQRRVKDGYPIAIIGVRHMQAHRLALMAKHGAALGSQAAHHTCAVSQCVNPDHLQPITHRENVAEMLARQSYLARIRDLEAALADVSPSHPLLAVIAVA